MDRLDWSAHSAHIRSLYRPWQPGDGYEEESVVAAEARCGVRVPAAVRSFYRTWGRRRDLTQLQEYLLAPEEWVAQAGAFIFCVENQGITYWAMQQETLAQRDPPVVIAEAGEELSLNEVTAELVWHPSHQHISDCLDDLAYMHAFAGGARHGGRSPGGRPDPRQLARLEREWGKARLTQMFQSHAVEPIDWWGSPVYVRDGQALWWFQAWSAVCGSEEALDEIARELDIGWEKRW
jgi:hypothetical protein